MKLKITKDFPFAHRGCEVVQYSKGQEVDTEDQALIEVALAEKWATKVKESQQPDNKALQQAPENKDTETEETPETPAADPEQTPAA